MIDSSEAGKALASLRTGNPGKKAAAGMTPEQRHERALKASHSRAVYKDLPKATHTGEICIGDFKIACAVLEGGRRLITQSAIANSLGRKTRKGSTIGCGTVAPLPNFLALEGLKPFLSEKVIALSEPLVFKQKNNSKAYGFEAALLPEVCEVYLKARDAGALQPSQMHIAARCDILIRALASVGITALVDEATGFQEERARNELQIILANYVSEELLPWTMKFPHVFFKQAYRLLGWQYAPNQCRHPGYLERFINKYIYEKMPPGVLNELQNKNPVTEKGHRAYQHHRFLTENIGHDHLDKHIQSVITLMKISDDKAQFDSLFNKAFEI